MKLEKIELHKVYMEALRLHNISWQKRLEGKRPWYKRDVFDTSHLPKDLWNPDYRYSIQSKLIAFIQPGNTLRDGSGTFVAALDFKEALVLLLNPGFLNSHYNNQSQVDLSNYKLQANTFNIRIIQ